jgi:flagellar FliL protein
MADAEKKEANPGADEGEANAGKKKKKMLFIIIGAVVGLVAIGGGAAFFLLGGKSEPKKEASAEQGAAAEHGAPGEDAKSDGHGEAKKEDADHGKGGQEEKKEEADHGKGGNGEDKDKKKEKGDEKGDGAKSADGVNFGETYSFKPFHLNLGNPLENHYVRMEVALEYLGGETQKVEIEKRLVQLRDAVVSVASRKSREFLLGPDGKDQLRREILIRVNRYMSKPVESVYITDILIE